MAKKNQPKNQTEKIPSVSACLAGPEEPRRHTTQVFITRVQLLHCLWEASCVSAPLPKMIPHPPPATSPSPDPQPAPTPARFPPSQLCTIHSISWISALNLQRLSGPRRRCSASHFPASLQPLTARSHTLPWTGVAHNSFRWDSQCFPCYPLLPSSPGSRAPARLLCVMASARQYFLRFRPPSGDNPERSTPLTKGNWAAKSFLKGAVCELTMARLDLDLLQQQLQ